jgi:hypothetical protein
MRLLLTAALLLSLVGCGGPASPTGGTAKSTAPAPTHKSDTKPATNKSDAGHVPG